MASIHFIPRPLAFPQGEVLACLLTNPTWSPAEIAQELALSPAWVSHVMRADLFQAHFRAVRQRSLDQADQELATLAE